MTISEFVAHLHSLDIRLWTEDERLRCSAPKGALTTALREELAARKDEILAWLSATSNGTNGELGGPAKADTAAHEPLSFAQQRLWFIDRFQPGGFAYNITGAIRMRGQLDSPALEWSLGEVVRRHESLRTTFTMVDGQPVQVVTPAHEFHVPVLDLSAEPGRARVRETKRLMLEEGRRPFDLERGPLFRARLMRLARDHNVLQLTMHHIVADGWSLALLARELTKLYQAHLDGPDAKLPPAPLRYAEIARRHRRRLRGPMLEKLEAYWRGRLTPLPPVLQLPTDYPRPALQGFNGAVESFVVRTPHVERLERLSREHGVTLFMTLFAAFNVMLSRHAGLTDIAIGVPIANRTDVEAEEVIGLMVNTLVLRTDLAGDPTFSELLIRVRDVALGAYEHQDLPFERLVEMLQPPRDLSHSVLFQVMFILQNLPAQALRLPGLRLSYPTIRTGTAKVDLTLEVVERPHGIHMHVEYNTDLFRADTIRRLCGHFERLLTAIASDPAERISRLPLLTEAEKHTITVEWNASDERESPSDTIPGFIESQADRTPDTPAVRSDTACLSYREMKSRVNRLARHLEKHGVGRNTLVGVFLERSVEMVVAVLAVLKAGGAYVPLDPSYPPDRLEFMLQDAQIRRLITCSELLTRVSLPSGLRATCLDRDASVIDAEPETNLPAGVDFEDLAYVIYTSGSTGRPKGVQITHRSLANVVAAFRTALDVTPSDVLVSVTTLSFDIAALELFLPLVSGAQLVIASREVAADPFKLTGLMARSRTTIMQATPGTWRMVLDAGSLRATPLRILCGGEALDPALAARLVASGASIWNVYGPTETTIWSTIHRVEGRESPVPIGRPIANTRTYVLDASGEPLPVGVPGELYIGGMGVAKGYLNRPDLTAERFVPDRFSGRPGARLYRTGDTVRFRADGTLEFLGRVDHQVKVRGFRIELDEIETVLTSHPAVIQAVVVARDGEPGDRTLAAYTRLKEPAEASTLRAYLAERLPDYMIPTSFTVLETFPLTPNGKVDRQRLPAPEAARARSPVSFIGPRSEMERAITQIWGNVLRRRDVGVDDNFFDLGGHSLLLVQAQVQLCRTLNRDLSIVEMFQYPTIRRLGAYLTRQAALEDAAEGSQI